MEKKGTYVRFEQKKPLVVGNKTYLCADDFRLTPFDLDIARRELHETEEIKIKSLKKLKEMLTKDAGVVYCTDDDFLLRYLRVAKFDCDKACKAVKKFYNVKKKNPNMMVITPQLQTLLEKNFIRRLPYKAEDGCFRFWIKLNNWKTEEMSFDDMMQLCMSVLDVFTMIPCLQVNGGIALYDFQGFTTSHVAQLLYPRNLLFLADFIQAIYPWRVKRTIVINFNRVLRAIYNAALRPLLKKKITERIIMIDSDMAELHKYINPVLLPKEYGGSLDEAECSITRPVMDNLHYVEYQRSFGAATENNSSSFQ